MITAAICFAVWALISILGAILYGNYCRRRGWLEGFEDGSRLSEGDS